MRVGLFALSSPTHPLARVRRSTRQRDPIRRDDLRRACGEVRLEEPERARDALDVEVVLLLGAKRFVSSSQTAVAETVDVEHTSAVYPGRSFSDERVP